MKILLVNPAFPEHAAEPRIAAALARIKKDAAPHDRLLPMPNLGLLTVAAHLPADVEVAFLDETIDALHGPVHGPPADFGTHAQGVDAVFLSATTPQAPRAYEIADAFRAAGTPVVIGGIHATALPDEAAAHADAVVVGEGEPPLPEILAEVAAGRLGRRSAGREGRAPAARLFPRGPNHDLSRFPVPRYDLVEPARLEIAPVQTQRGCPIRCAYCAAITVSGPEVRAKPIDAVIREIEAVRARNPRAAFLFVDDNLFIARRRAADLLRALVPLRIRWFTYSDISIADDPALLDLAREAGCFRLFVGLESVDPTALAQGSAWKVRRIARYAESIERIQSRGIGVFGSFVLGFDGDTEETVAHLRAFLDEVPLYRASFALLTPYPGTPLFRDFEAQGRIVSRDWSRYNEQTVVYAPRHLTPDRLADAAVELLDHFFSGPLGARRVERFRAYAAARAA